MRENLKIIYSPILILLITELFQSEALAVFLQLEMQLLFSF